ncbi:MAG: glycosyltransferase family 2 protein [Thermoguttaceae bacterium]
MQGISVIIPVYNREVFLKEAIESVLAQEYNGPIEIVVADDGSTDRSVEVAESFGPPVKVIRKPDGCTDQGPGPARNRAIEASVMPYIAFLDSDDLFLPGHLQRLANALDKEPNVMMVFDEAKTMINGKVITFPYPEWFKKTPDACAMFLEPLPPTNAIVLRRNVLDIIGLFDHELVYSEDIDLRLRIAERFPIQFVEGFGSVIREHSDRSIVKGRGKKLFVYDSLMIKKAHSRYPYPKKIVRAKKAKLYYFLAISEFEQGSYLSCMRIMLWSLFISPGIYVAKIREKFFKHRYETNACS